MSLIPMEYAGGGLKTLATGTSGQTYGQQLATLWSEFSKAQYSDYDKLRMYIKWYNIYTPCSTTDGGFASAPNADTVYVFALGSTPSAQARGLANGTLNDMTNNVLNTAMSLVIIED